jgi:hypothetical protein
MHKRPRCQTGAFCFLGLAMTPRQFFAAVLIFLGGAIAVLSGGCTILVVGIGAPMTVEMLLNGRGTIHDVMISAAIPLAFGVCPFCVGFWLYKFGQRLKDPTIVKKKIEIE